jgi:hypothetical protein
VNRLFAGFVLCLLLWGGCEEHSTGPPNGRAMFKLYALANTTLTATLAWSLPVDSLSLAASPFLTEKDLTAYYWSTHSFTARPNIDSMFSRMRWAGGKSSGVPFVVVAMNTRIYVGAFWWAYSSSIPMGAYIDVYDPPLYVIKREQLASTPDMRSDRRIHDALKATGVLLE